jgi:hypothetical protein
VRILGSLREAMPEPPALDWGRYRADLRARLDGSRVSWWSWWSRPVPLALSATLAGVLLALTWLTQPGTPGRPELQAAEEATLGRRVGLLRDWPVVERLDLLENFDVITQLDDLESEG